MALDNIYKSGLPASHEAGLQAVYQAGYAQGMVDTQPAPEAPAPQAPADETTPPAK